jgi:putative membrane protein
VKLAAARTTRLAALTGATLLVSAVGSSAGIASATSDDSSERVEVVNTETVQVYLDPDGRIDSKRVYEQLSLTGHGAVDLRNPIETDGLRNLDGFGGFTVKDGQQLVDTTVDGRSTYRSVSSYDGDLPLTVSVRYSLDGKTVEPGDLIGRSGHLEVEFTVANDTAAEQELTFDDGKGGTVTKTVEVPLPIVGSLETTAPANFTNVESEAANMAGNGEGGTLLSYNMTLFPPIGKTTATFEYSADITDGVVPRVEVSALPVDPLGSPLFKTAADGYQGGAQTGAQLAAGATEIDTNLLKIHDGAAELLDGLIRLNDGAEQLSAGLNNEAAPGAHQLADGAGQLADGSTKARAGSAQLTDGLRRIDGGLEQLADAQSGMPAAADGIRQLRDGVRQLLDGLGQVGDEQTLIGGLDALARGLGTAHTGSGQLTGGLKQLRGTGSTSGLGAAKAGVDTIRAGLRAALGSGGSVDSLIAGLGMAKTFCASQPTPELTGRCNGLIDQLLAGAQTSKTSLGAAAAGLGEISTGLGTALTSLDLLLIPGMEKLQAGIGEAQVGATKLKGGAIKVEDGLHQVDDGLQQLAAGVTKAVAGVMKLSAGAGQAYDGSAELTSGLGQLDDGAGRLSDGANQLADGLDTAADGSSQLADGLGQAAQGAPRLVDGSQRLSDEGTKKLVEAGVDTAQSYGELVAVMKAGADRAHTDDMAYGAPDDAVGLTAYRFVMQGDDGESGRNLARGLAGLALLGAGGGVLFLRRRFALA